MSTPVNFDSDNDLSNPYTLSVEVFEAEDVSTVGATNMRTIAAKFTSDWAPAEVKEIELISFEAYKCDCA